MADNKNEKNIKITKTEKPVKVKKEKKPKKPVSAKKLPGLLKKSYTEKNFDKKILKKIYIADDKKFIASFFKTNEKGLLAIPRDIPIPQEDFRRLKLLGSEIKRQKGIINVVPFAAVVIFFAAIGITVTIFKNKVVKYAITTGMQNVFEAKTDIADVDLKIFASSLRITGLEQADSDDPMKNIFEIQNITLDFNLAQLLRGKFDAEDISVTGIALGTKRKTSGALPIKAIKIKSSETKKTEKTTGKKSIAAVSSVKESLSSVFADYDPNKIISNLEANIKSPELAKEVQKQAESLTKKWKDKPAELKKEVTDFKEQVQKITSKDWSKTSNPAELAEALKTAQEAIESGKKLKESTQSAAKQMSSDTKTVKELKDNLNSAIKNDRALVKKELDKFSSFSMDTAKSLMTDSITAVGYSVLGKYYPYVEKGVSIAQKFASQSKDEKAAKKKVKAKTNARMKGLDIYYKADNVPVFLIEKAAASGTNFSANLKEVSSDPDKRGKPAIFDGKFQNGNQKHVFDGTVDGRSTSSEPLVKANYSGTNYPVSESMEVLNMKGNAAISLKAAADLDKSFSAKGTVNLSDLKLDSDSFSPEIACNVYKSALKSIKTMKIDFTAEHSSDGDLNLKISTDADKLLASAMKNIISEQMESIKTEAANQIMKKLDEQTKGATGAISEYLDVEKLMNGEISAVDAVNKALESKKDDIQKQIKKQAANKATEAVKDKLPEGANKLLKGLF